MMDDVADMVRLSQLMTCDGLVYTADSKSDYMWCHMALHVPQVELIHCNVPFSRSESC